MEKCTQIEPECKQVTDEHRVACWLTEED
jgi:hypothetical protein